MTGSRLIARNVLATVLTQVLSWGLTFLVTLYLPAYVGDAGLGKLAFATAWVGMFAVCVPLGTSTVLVKEIARDHGRLGELLPSALALRIPLGLLMAALTPGLTYLLGYPPLTCVLVAVTAGGAVLASLNDAFSSALGGLERMPRQSLALLVEKVLTAGLTLFLISRRAPLWALAGVVLCSGLVSLAVNLSAFIPLFRSFTWPRREAVRSLFLAGLPFLGWTVFRTLYGQTDPVVLSLLTDDHTVGWYAAAFRLTGTTLFLPGAVGAALLPTLSRLYATDPDGFRKLSRRMLTLAVLCGTPIALVLIFLPQPLLALLHYPPEFRASIPVLQIGGFAVLLWYAAMMLGTTVVAADGQARMVRTSMLSAFIGIPMCVAGSLLTHRLLHNGAIGAMTSDVLLECFLIAMYLRIMPAGVFDFSSLKEAGRCVLAAVPMIAFLLLMAPRHPQLWLAVPSAAIYLTACYLLRCFDPGLFALARSAFSRSRSAG